MQTKSGQPAQEAPKDNGAGANNGQADGNTGEKTVDPNGTLAENTPNAQ